MLYVGSKRKIQIPQGGFLYIHDTVPRINGARIFKVGRDSFNPLKGLDERAARELADALISLYPQGENTLTVRNLRRALPGALLAAKRLDKVNSNQEVMELIEDVLFNPLVRTTLCGTEHFSFNVNSKILAPLDRAKIGEFEARAIGVMLMAHYKGTLVVPGLGFYGTDVHVTLARQKRLIGGANYLDELPEKLRNLMMLGDVEGRGTTYADAVTLAQYARLRKDTNEWNDFIDGAMA